MIFELRFKIFVGAIFCLFLKLSAQAQYNRIFVFLNKRTDQAELPKEQVDKLMEGHMANIYRLAKEGKLVAAGPFDGGGGIFIFNSTSVEEVKSWLATDPGVQADRWKLEMLPFQFRLGKDTPLKEPYEMVSYQFIRFTPNIAKFNIQEVPELFVKHDDYLKEIKRTGNEIMEGIFGDTEGGVLVMKGDLDSAVIERDPAVQQGLLQFEIKKLWIAKGTFGEK
ncbi:MAG: YciI family protein [Flammeovirgaceae bacterium]